MANLPVLHDLSSGIFAGKFPDKHSCKWMKQTVIALAETTEVYMVEIIANFHC